MPTALQIALSNQSLVEATHFVAQGFNPGNVEAPHFAAMGFNPVYETIKRLVKRVNDNDTACN